MRFSWNPRQWYLKMAELRPGIWGAILDFKKNVNMHVYMSIVCEYVCSYTFVTGYMRVCVQICIWLRVSLHVCILFLKRKGWVGDNSLFVRLWKLHFALRLKAAAELIASLGLLITACNWSTPYQSPGHRSCDYYSGHNTETQAPEIYVVVFWGTYFEKHVSVT